MMNIELQIAALHQQYDELQQAMADQDWSLCQQQLLKCHQQFERLFNMPDPELVGRFEQLKALQERHAEILHAVKKIRDSLSAQLGNIRKGKVAQQYYQDACSL